MSSHCQLVLKETAMEYSLGLLAALLLLFNSVYMEQDPLSDRVCNVPSELFPSLHGEAQSNNSDSILCFFNNSSYSFPSLNFTGKSYVGLIGKGHTTLHCNNISEQIIFTNVTEILLQNIKVQQCGTISLKKAFYISIQNTLLNRTKLVIYGQSHVISLENSLFIESSTIQIYSTASLKAVNCTFQGNKQGGLRIGSYSIRDVRIEIEKCVFDSNMAINHGGGLYLDIYYHKNLSGEVRVTESYFHGNSAQQLGGGVYMIVESEEESEIVGIFKNCTWKGNEAVSGAAVRLKVLSTKNNKCSFEDCFFHSNQASESDSSYSLSVTEGSLLSSGCDLLFVGWIKFSMNSRTALCLVSATLEVTNNTIVTFDNNYGINGGAMALYKMSHIKVSDGVQLQFNHNKAKTKGGAIFIETQHNTNHCSINSTNNSINWTFMENSILIHNVSFACLIHGCDIYMLNVRNCETILSNVKDRRIATRNKLEINNTTDPLKFIPGKRHTIPINIVNDLNGSIALPILVHLEGNNMTLNTSSELILSQSEVQIHGSSGANGFLVLFTVLEEEEDTNVSVNVTLLPCPPGYIIADNSCSCESTNYLGIKKCQIDMFQVALKFEYWMGYDYLDSDNVTYGDEDSLYSAFGPLQYLKHSANHENDELLPITSDVKLLIETVCESHRKGFLCAECRKSMSVFYHSENFDCLPDNNCSLGWLIFLVSEICPVTLMFLVILFFNIKLTSGSVQGFILFTQLFDFLHITTSQHVEFLKHASSALRFIRFIYRMLNLEPFTHNKLSFCLYKGAKTVEILAIKYVTIFYSLLLVVTVVLVWNKCCLKIRIFRQKIGRNSVLHGLSSFLSLCYFQCTKVTLLLLLPVHVYGKDWKFYKKVLLYDGKMEYLEGTHLYMAIPIFLAVFPIIILPPILLFVYPLCYNMFRIFRIHESKFSTILCKVIPLERFRPFFDSFQSCFKDEHRYFAGLYFSYRCLILLIFAYSKNMMTFYTLVQALLILMLSLHCWVQPYKSTWHNKLDSYFFCTLVAINSIIIYMWTWTNEDHRDLKSFASRILVLLAYLPLFVIPMQFVCTRQRNWKKFWKHIPLLDSVRIFKRRQNDDASVLNLSEERRAMELYSSYKKE